MSSSFTFCLWVSLPVVLKYMISNFTILYDIEVDPYPQRLMWHIIINSTGLESYFPFFYCPQIVGIIYLLSIFVAISPSSPLPLNSPIPTSKSTLPPYLFKEELISHEYQQNKANILIVHFQMS